MRTICPICDLELQVQPVGGKNVLRAVCPDCDILLVTYIQGIYKSGYVSQTNDFEDWMKVLSKKYSILEN